MAKFMIFILLLSTLSYSFSLKKDKFKIKAKGFGLKNIKPIPIAAPEAPPAPAPSPYYPPAPVPYYPSSPSHDLSGTASAIKSAGLNTVTSIPQQVIPVIIPITLMAQSAFEPLNSAVSGLNSHFSNAQMHIPRVDFEVAHASAPGPDMGSDYGYSAVRNSRMGFSNVDFNNGYNNYYNG